MLPTVQGNTDVYLVTGDPVEQARAPEVYNLLFGKLGINAVLDLNAGDALPCDVASFAPHAAVVDILMKNQSTPFVRASRAPGLVAEPGIEMLIQQAPDYLDFFGHVEAAQLIRQDATFIRQHLYPASMLGEIWRSASRVSIAAKEAATL